MHINAATHWITGFNSTLWYNRRLNFRHRVGQLERRGHKRVSREFKRSIRFDVQLVNSDQVIISVVTIGDDEGGFRVGWFEDTFSLRCESTERAKIERTFDINMSNREISGFPEKSTFLNFENI